MGSVLAVLLSCGAIYICGYFMVDRIITTKRIKENQKAWEEFSKGMTEYEKMDCHIEWCERRKMEKGWRFYYFPRQ